MQKVCNSEDGGLNDALKLARRVENDGVVASAALELSGTPPRFALVVVAAFPPRVSHSSDMTVRQFR